MFKNNKILPLALLAMTHSVFAAPPLPSAGSQIQQIPPTPTPQKALPKVELQPADAVLNEVGDTAKIIVNRLQIKGAQAYSEPALLAVTGFQSGAEMTLSGLRAMAARIADYYHKNGYFLAQAYLPAQDIQGGVVTIAVIDGQYGKVTLNNRSGVSDGLANNLLGGLNAGDAVTSAALENRLLLLSDLPGVKVSSTLLPGASPGASDLVVNLTPGERISGSVDADNAGNRYTGQYRLGATVNWNEPAGLGDVASLRVLTAGAGLNYARGSYQLHAGKATVGVAYSYLHYALGREFDSLDAHGTAQVASLYGSYPLIRSRNTNLSAQLLFEHKKFQDLVDATASASDKTARVLTGSLFGDHRDGLGGGGLTTYSAALSSGEIDLQTPVVAALDAVTARSNGHFSKLGLSATRLQRVTDTVSLYGAISGQFASKNLDVSEKLELGGLYGVRAYPEGEAFGDQGALINLEARFDVPRFSAAQTGQFQLIGFVDSGTVTINKNPWAAGSNHRTLSGAGIGLNWSDTNNFVVRAFYAHKLGSQAATSAPDASGRFWIQAVKYF
jgi:hemolysin activation/secretion protein